MKSDFERLQAENAEYKRRLRNYKLALATAMGGTISDTMYDKDLEKAVKAKRKLCDDINTIIEKRLIVPEKPSWRMRLVLFIAHILRVELYDKRYIEALYQIAERIKT